MNEASFEPWDPRPEHIVLFLDDRSSPQLDPTGGWRPLLNALRAAAGESRTWREHVIPQSAGTGPVTASGMIKEAREYLRTYRRQEHRPTILACDGHIIDGGQQWAIFQDVVPEILRDPGIVFGGLALYSIGWNTLEYSRRVYGLTHNAADAAETAYEAAIQASPGNSTCEFLRDINPLDPHDTTLFANWGNSVAAAIEAALSAAPRVNIAKANPPTPKRTDVAELGELP